MIEFNKQQKEAIKHKDGPLLLLAGAGSGKTMTLIYRTVELIRSGVPEETILLLTFTNKAANEMKKRMEKALGRPVRLTACTYHSFCNRLLRYYSRKGYVPRNFTVLSAGDEPDLIDMVKVRLHMEKDRGLPPNKTIVNMISASINKQIPLIEVVQEDEKYEDKYPEINQIAQELKKYKKENNLMNYDDLLLAFRDLLKKHKEIQEDVERSYRYIMVDEYQDTNFIQDEILSLMRQKNTNIVVVGDDSQSLYGFRGAEVRNIIRFPDKYEGCKRIDLMENYRSNQEILDVANHVIHNHATEGYQKTLHGQWVKGEKPFLYYTNDINDESETILDMIKTKLREGIPPKEICVLARTSMEFAQLEIRLTQEGIPYEKYGGLKFLDKACIKDMLALLRVVSNPLDEIAWYRSLQLHPGVGQVYARQISSDCVKVGYEALIRKERRKYTKWLAGFKKELDKARKGTLGDIIKSLNDYYIKIRTEVIQTMNTTESKRSTYMMMLEESKMDLMVLVALAEGYRSLNSFLDDLVLDGNPQLNQSSEQIVLSTIHSIKGLEFHTVMIMNCIDEVFPSTSAREHGTKEDNEELRCFYVAVTRAKEDLILFAPSFMMKWGKPVNGRVSHFISDGLELFQEKDDTW